jgi:predicted transcriptional regulator
MNRLKTINSEILLKKQLKNNEFKKEYDKLEEEFELAKEIIKLRKNAELTQKQLAELAGTSQPAIARLESGNYKNLSLSFLRKVGNALNAKPEIHFKKIKINS